MSLVYCKVLACHAASSVSLSPCNIRHSTSMYLAGADSIASSMFLSSSLLSDAMQATMQGFAALAGEDGIVSLDTLAPAPASSFPAAHASALAAAAAVLLPPEQQPAPHGSVSALQLLAAAAAVGLVPRPGTGAVFSR